MTDTSRLEAMPAARFTAVSPVIPVSDLDAALDRYRRLGFTAHAYEGPERYGFAERDSISIHLSEWPTHDAATEGAVVYLVVDDADAVHSQWVSSGIDGRFVEPADMAWGMREFAFVDADGTLHRVGTPLAVDEDLQGRPSDMKLQVVVLPVSDVDRAREFYLDGAGFGLDVDHRAGEDFRLVQLTPPGSACSITLMKNVAAAGSVQGLQLVVADIQAARAELVQRNVEASEIFHFHEGTQVLGPDPQRRAYGSFFAFSDPDGNSFMVQEVSPGG